MYEALFFNKPIVVSEETFLSEKLKRINCGFTIDASDNQSIISFLDSIKIEEINTIKDHISKIDNNDIIDDDSERIIYHLNEVLQEKLYI